MLRSWRQVWREASSKNPRRGALHKDAGVVISHNRFSPKHSYHIIADSDTQIREKTLGVSSLVDYSVQSAEAAHFASTLLWTDMGIYYGSLEQKGSQSTAVGKNQELPVDSVLTAETLGSWRIGWLRDPETGAHWAGFHHTRI